ncbi:MAG: DUF1553 domain-containing protein [Planctomycetes bacterium]|nr:DUF1553 domain-containing protein [Planctomycetota bacterium]
MHDRRTRLPGRLAKGGCLLSLWLLSSRAGAADPEPAEALPAGLKLTGIAAFPQKIEIVRRFEYAQVVLTASVEGADPIDVTRIAKAEVTAGGAACDLVEVSPRGVVRPKRDGACEVRFTVGDHAVTVPVTVRGQAEPFVADFIADVAPVLSRIGCNAGTCHGSAQGRKGFKLSLRGNDPFFDHVALTDDLAARRFNRANPEQSLFLLKVSGTVPHEGGVHTRPGEPYYEILKSWIVGGANLNHESPRVVKIEVFPKEVVIPLPGMRQQVAVHAAYSDGRVRDVSGEAFVETSNVEVATADRHGVVTAVRRGEAAVMARFEGNYTVTQFYVMGDRKGFEWKEVPEHNYIDALAYEKLRRVKTLPSDLCTDAELIRRVYLDLTGLPPKPRDVRAFLLDERDSKAKRDELIDRLIGSAEFVEHWTSKWADLLQVNERYLSPQGVAAFTGWIRKAVASNIPYDKLAHSILAASGSTMANPPAAYYKILRQPDLAMENTTQLFLGVRFNCNKCHDHPFERWTQANHWQLAAYFAQVGRANAPNSPQMPATAENQLDERPAIEEIISDGDSGEVTAPYSGKTVPATFPYQHDGGVPQEGSRRAKLAAWLTSPKNPYFARSYVNRLWSYLLGAGLIDPADDIRASNPPSNPELLDRLTADFIESGFDVRRMLRTICKSRVYQHSCQTNAWNEDDSINFSHALARRLPAETLFDAIHQATGSVAKLPGVRRGTRAAELPGPAVETEDGFLGLFGRPPRQSACECERVSGVSLGHALSLVNGPTVAEAVRDPQNAIADLVRIERSTESIVEGLYVSFLCRPPAAEERAQLARAFDPGDPASPDALSPQDAQALATRFAEWEKRQHVVTWQPLEVGIRKSAGGATLASKEDGSVLAGGANPEKDVYTLVAWTDLRGITGFRLEVLPDESLKAKGPGRSENGNFVLTELRVAAAPARDPGSAKSVALQNPTTDFAQEGLPIANVIDGKPETGWAILPRTGQAHHATFEAKEDVGAEGGAILTFVLEQGFGSMHTIGRLRLSATTSKRPVQASTVPEDVAAVLLKEPGARSEEEKSRLWRAYIAQDPDMAEKIRLGAAQDLAWALINSPAFLFNR